MGYGGCEPRIEGIVKKNWGGGGVRWGGRVGGGGQGGCEPNVGGRG